MSEVTREQVLGALAQVKDPELNRNLVELNMVRDLQIDGGRVEVEIALTVRGCPLRYEIKKDVEAKLLAIPGVSEAVVHLGAMTDEERQQLIEKFRQERVPKSRIMAEDSRTVILAISSGKGGVGKSTVTANLAAALSARGYKVGVLDADIYGFSIPGMLGIEGRKPVAFNKAIVPIPAHGMQVMSMGFFVDADTPLIWRGPMLMGAVEQFLADVLWDDLDFFLIDLPPGTGDVPLSIMQKLPRAQIVVVTTPQPASVTVAQRTGIMARKVQHEVLGVIENMSYLVCSRCGERHEIFGSGGGRQLAEKLGTRLLGQLPIQEELREASDAGKPVALYAPESAVARAFLELADRIAELTLPAERRVAAVTG